MKKIFAIAVATVFIIGSTVPVFAIDAVPTASTILLNGMEVKVGAYNIDGSNYFKLRDIAYMLNGTEKQFNVAYNGALNSIVLTSRQSYTPVGGEMTTGNLETMETSATSSKIIKDGVEIEMAAYNIDGNNYFKLRDLGEKFNFGVDYDEKTNSVQVSTGNSEDINATSSDENGQRTNPFTASVLPTPIPGVEYSGT